MSKTYRNRGLSLKLKRKDTIADDTLDYTDNYSAEDSTYDLADEDNYVDDGYILEPEPDSSFEVVESETDDNGNPVDGETVVEYESDYLDVVMSDEDNGGTEIDEPIDEFEEYYYDPDLYYVDDPPEGVIPPDPAYCCSTDDGCFIIGDSGDGATESAARKRKRNRKAAGSKKQAYEHIVIKCKEEKVWVRKNRGGTETELPASPASQSTKRIKATFGRVKSKKKPVIWFARLGEDAELQIRLDGITGNKRGRLLTVKRDKSKRLSCVIAHARPKERSEGNEATIKRGKRSITVKRNRRGKIRAVSYQRGDLVIVIVGKVRY